MREQHGARYDDDTLRAAALKSQTLHPDFARLLDRIEARVLPKI